MMNSRFNYDSVPVDSPASAIRRCPNNPTSRHERCTCNGCHTRFHAYKRRMFCEFAAQHPRWMPARSCILQASLRRQSDCPVQQVQSLFQRVVIFTQYFPQHARCTIAPYVNAFNFARLKLHSDSCSCTHNSLYFSRLLHYKHNIIIRNTQVN